MNPNPIDRVALLAEEFSSGSWERCVLGILGEHAKGRKNAKPLSWVIPLLEPVFGKNPRWANNIQNRVVKASRKEGTDCFICSCREGFYIPMTREDAVAMQDFYSERIAQETFNLGVLSNYAELLD